MTKKKPNTQNIVIAILSILLLISIAFSVTYSYYNSKSNLVKGSIIPANLSISLFGQNTFGQTCEFSITAPWGDNFLVPGNKLDNVELNLLNKYTQSTYIVVAYSVTAYKNNQNKEDVTHLLKDVPPISFKNNSINTNVWNPILYKCQNNDLFFTCLVGINPFPPSSSANGDIINILQPNSIEIPIEWDNSLQGCCVTISVVAYAVQADSLPANYHNEILTAQNNNDLEAKSQAIAKATLQICQIDVSSVKN